jgi:acyl-CoA thioesterase
MTMTQLPPFVLDRSWWSYAGPHGGFLASRLLAAATDLTDHPARSLHVQFVAAAAEGPADIDATVVREGRSATFVDALMSSGDRLVAKSSIVLGATRPGPGISGPPAPAVEQPEDLPELTPPVDFVPFSQNLEYRPSGDNGGLASGRAQILGWIRFRDDRPVDGAAATILVDAPPPALYGALVHPVPIPTADLHVQYAGVTELHDDPWSLVRIVTSSAGDGWCVDDSEVWDRSGRLVATARQTRLVLRGAA